MSYNFIHVFVTNIFFVWIGFISTFGAFVYWSLLSKIIIFKISGLYRFDRKRLFRMLPIFSAFLSCELEMVASRCFCSSYIELIFEIFFTLKFQKKIPQMQSQSRLEIIQVDKRTLFSWEKYLGLALVIVRLLLPNPSSHLNPPHRP